MLIHPARSYDARGTLCKMLQSRGTLMILMVLQHSHVNKEILMQYTEGHKEL